MLGRRWLFLAPAVRRRFLRKIALGGCVTYVGEVVECRMSIAGRLLAQVARLIGAPLPLGSDTGVSASVSITTDKDGRSQYWTRQYGRRHGFPQVIHSAKRFAGPTGLEEYLGLGVGIALRLEERGGALWFVSDHYFLRLAGVRLPIRNGLIGQLLVGHTDLGSGRFAFSLDLVHPWLGELVHQLAVFADPPEHAA
ncbi:hypothetical protein BXU08_09295 [Sphingomonas sp. LM7]|nr:hypothetical protein BXU08_09295 [Sphingomonas sp. LM7]